MLQIFFRLPQCLRQAAGARGYGKSGRKAQRPQFGGRSRQSATKGDCPFTLCGRPLGDAADQLAVGRLPVQPPLAGDYQICLAKRLFEACEIEHQVDASPQAGFEKISSPEAQPTGRAGAGLIPGRRSALPVGYRPKVPTARYDHQFNFFLDGSGIAGASPVKGLEIFVRKRSNNNVSNFLVTYADNGQPLAPTRYKPSAYSQPKTSRPYARFCFSMVCCAFPSRSLTAWAA